MRLILLFIFAFIFLASCGKKSNPEFQGKIKKSIVISV